MIPSGLTCHSPMRAAVCNGHERAGGRYPGCRRREHFVVPAVLTCQIRLTTLSLSLQYSRERETIHKMVKVTLSCTVFDGRPGRVASEADDVEELERMRFIRSPTEQPATLRMRCGR